MYGIKRPSNKDTEEDLLKFQQEFVEKLNNDPSFKSNISVELIKQRTKEDAKSVPEKTENEVEEKMEQHDFTLPSLLRRVTETANTHEHVFPQESNLPFPKAIGIDLKSLQQSAVIDTRAKKKSLFALHMEKQGKGIAPDDKLNFPTPYGQDIPHDVMDTNMGAKNVMGMSIITGEGLASRELDAKSEIDQIHQENMDRLARMTKDEILQEQEKIRTSLDPNLLDFLKNRKRKQNTTHTQEMEIDPVQTLERDGEIQGLIGEAKRQKWKHFDVLEAEKLEWTQTKNNVSKEARKPRFDFSGSLITSDDVISTDTGLFHHGEDSGHPGYTLEELMHLSESTFQSQKMLSLQTLACIAKNAQNDNSVHQKLEANLLKVMVDIGIPMLFRVAMDNSTLPILCIGILGIRNLLVNDIDVEFLHQVQYSSLGLSLPMLNSTLEPVRENESEDSDIEVMQQDLVQGLIQTSILARIRYLLQTVKPPATSVICCLEIIIHFARYAKSIAIQVANDEKLINAILVNFLPFDLTLEKENGSYGQPCVEAIDLFCCLIQASKTCSTILLGKHRLIEKLIQFALLDLNAFKDKQKEIAQFIISSLNSLRSLACYGLGLEYFQSGYDRYISKLQGCYGRYTELSQDEFNCLTLLIHYVTEVSLALAFSREHRIELLNPIIEIVQGICDKATLAMQIGVSSSQQRILSAIYNLFSTLVSKPVVNKFNSPVDIMSSFETITTVQYTKLCQSKAMRHIFTSFLQLSSGLEKCSATSCVKSLLRNKSVESEYITTTDLIYSLIRFNNSASKQLVHLKIKSFLNLSGLYQLVVNYFQNLVAQNNTLKASPAFFLLEIPIIYKILVSCQSELDTNPRERQLIHNVLFCLIVWLHPGQECYLKDILQTFIFSPKFYQPNDSTALTNDELKSIKFTYNSLLQFLNVNEVSIDYSNNRYNRSRVDLDSLALPSFHSPLFPIDWITMPIFVLYNKEESKPNIPGGFHTNVRFLTDCLKFYNYVEFNGTPSLSCIQPSSRVARILLAFLLGDMFLTDEINTELSKTLELYSNQDFISNLDFSGSIQGVTDFVELYAELCSHFTSVSFGDPTYALFLLLPLISNPSTHIKLIIWKNNMDIFRLFPIPISSISLPIKRLLHPHETDIHVLASMIQALIQEKIRLTWSPVFYLMAVHHIRAFISREPRDSNEKAIGINLLNALLKASEKLREDFVRYSEELSVSGRAFKKSELSSHRLLVSSVYEEAMLGSEMFGREAEKISGLIEFV